MEGQQGEDIDAVARHFAQQEIGSEAAVFGEGSFHLADLFDEEAQGTEHHGPVEAGAADAGGQSGVADFAEEPAGDGGGGTYGAFGKR